MEHYLGVARENGFSEEQIGAVQGIVMAVCAGKVNATFRSVEARLKEKK
jgi:hypothetical protein